MCIVLLCHSNLCLSPFHLLINFISLKDYILVVHIKFKQEKPSMYKTIPQISVSQSAFHPGFQWGLCFWIFSFLCNVLFIVVCPFVLFHLAIVLQKGRTTVRKTSNIGQPRQFSHLQGESSKNIETKSTHFLA